MGSHIDNSTVLEILSVAFKGQLKTDAERIKADALNYTAEHLTELDLSSLKCVLYHLLS